MAVSKAAIPKIAHIIEPNYSTSTRAEFRFDPETAYFSDFRLINVGITSGTPTIYNSLLGAEAPIKRISLLDGGVTLEALNEAQFLRAWQKTISLNNTNISVGRYTTHNELGYIATGIVNDQASNHYENQVIRVAQAQANTVNSAGSEKQAWISLRDMFPLLASTPIMATNVFKQLRVVIEFSNANELKKLVKKNNVADLAATRPLMLAEELAEGEFKMNAMSGYRGSTWFSWEQDSYLLDAATGASGTALSVPQANKAVRVRGFNGKYIRELVLQMTPTIDPVDESDATLNKPYGKFGSLALYKPQIQVRVNGSNKIPRSGIIGNQRRLALLSDTLGTQNTFAAQGSIGITFSGERFTDGLENTIGQLNLVALDIEDQVDELQVTVGRDAANAQTSLNQSVRVNCWAHVAKAIVMAADGTYNIVNASA